MSIGSRIGVVVKYAVLIIFAFWSAVPIFLVILNSFKRKLDIFTNPPSLIFTPTLSNYQKIFLTDDYVSYYRNSLIITGTTTMLSIFFGLLAAYGIVYFGLKHGSKIANIFLWVKMIPPITMLLPLFSMLYYFNLHNSVGLIRDEEGVDLPDLDSAREEAIRNARALIADDVLKGRLDLKAKLDILAEDGTRLFALRFADAIEVSADSSPTS